MALPAIALGIGKIVSGAIGATAKGLAVAAKATAKGATVAAKATAVELVYVFLSCAVQAAPTKYNGSLVLVSSS